MIEQPHDEPDLDRDPPPLPEMTDGRTPGQLKADGDHRWPDGSRYTPPHLKGKARERFARRQDEVDLVLGRE